MQHRFAYVGNDLQDLYGIHAGTIARATTISDAYFGDGHARQRLAALNRTEDGVYVSDETVKDFVLRIGDTIRLRLLDASSHAYVPVVFHVLGVVREFPTAPTDSFLVANAAYVARQTHSNAHETLLVRAKSSPPAVAATLRTLIPPVSGAQVRDIVEQRRITATGLVALDLGGLSALNLAFGALGTLWAVALLLAIAYVERRRQFAILRALGAKGRHVAAFVGTEAGSVVALGSLAGLLLGGVIGWVLVRVLRGVFDPPPAHPVVPWAYLGVLVAVIAGGLVAAVAFELRHSARLRPEALRDFSM
jgi:putative ABC transport system permease protein